MKETAATAAMLLFALTGCGGSNDSRTNEAPPSSQAPAGVRGGSPDSAGDEVPVSVVVHVRDGIEAVAGAEALYVEDALPLTDATSVLRVERRFHAAADGTIRIRTPRTSSCVRGLWVRGRTWHRLLSSAGRAEPMTLLVNIGFREPEYSAVLSVVDGSGRPIATATVTALLHPEAGPDPTIPRVATDSAGHAVLSQVPHDVVAVDVSAPGFVTIRTWAALHRAADREPRGTTVELPRAVPVDLHFAAARPGDAVMTEFAYQDLRQAYAHAFQGTLAHVAIPVGPVCFAVYREGDRIRSLNAMVSPETTRITID